MLGSEILGTSISGNTIQTYGQAFGIFVAAIFVLQIVKNVLLARLQSFVKNTNNHWDDIFCNALESLDWPFYFTVAIFAATRSLSLVGFLESFIQSSTLIIVTYYVVRSMQTVLEYSLDRIFI